MNDRKEKPDFVAYLNNNTDSIHVVLKFLEFLRLSLSSLRRLKTAIHTARSRRQQSLPSFCRRRGKDLKKFFKFSPSLFLSTSIDVTVYWPAHGAVLCSKERGGLGLLTLLLPIQCANQFKASLWHSSPLYLSSNCRDWIQKKM